MSESHENNSSTFFRKYDLVRARTPRATDENRKEKLPAPHQQIALDKLGKWYDSAPSEPRGAILVLPTGGGKTFTAVHFTCRRALSDEFKVLWLAHTHHLLEQAQKSFDDLVHLIQEPKSHIAIRVVSGATGHFPVHSIAATDDVVIASLQATARAATFGHGSLDEFLKSACGKLLVVFDEAHHSPAPTYRRLLQHLRERCPDMMLLGLTATPTYSDPKKSGWLLKLFPQNIVHQETAQNLMGAKVLAKPVFEGSCLPLLYLTR